MTFPKSFTDREILELEGTRVESGYRLRVLNPELDPTFRYVSIYPDLSSSVLPFFETKILEPNELTIFSIHKEEVCCLATTRRLLWLDAENQIQSISFNNIRDVGLMAGLGDPAYPPSFRHYFVNGVLHEGYPPENISFKDCNPKFYNPFMYLIDTDGNRHVVKLVEKFPIYSAIDLLGNASERVPEAQLIKNQQRQRKGADR